MKRPVLLAVLRLVVSQVLIAQNSASNAPPSEHHEFVITNFRTESGVTLPQARMVYGTYGHLNAAILCSFFPAINLLHNSLHKLSHLTKK